MKRQSISDVIKSDLFQKAIRDAIECGEHRDWVYDGENEYAIDTFDSREALEEVIKVIKKHLV
jgi:hypothetical protein